MFEKLAETRKNVRKQFLEDKIGKIESSESLETFFKPVTESQKESTKDIQGHLSHSLMPIREEIMNIPIRQTLARSLTPSDAREELTMLGPIAIRYLERYMDRSSDVDKTFGIYDDEGTWKIGNEPVTVEGNDLIIDKKRYVGTLGLWELIVENNPSEQNYTNTDYETYAEILNKTNAMRQGNNPINPRPKSSKSWKWNNVVRTIWEHRPGAEGQGIETIVIPSDPNALLERFDLLMASKAAGNTGTRNELTSICDELLRQKVINKNEYKILC
jgi:hypothetical protein